MHSSSSVTSATSTLKTNANIAYISLDLLTNECEITVGSCVAPCVLARCKSIC